MDEEMRFILLFNEGLNIFGRVFDLIEFCALLAIINRLRIAEEMLRSMGARKSREVGSG